MPGWFVAVELPTRDTTQQEKAALIAACSAALGRGKCALSEAAESARAVAVVSFRGSERLRALVEVGRREAESRSWRSQEIAFKPEDERLERFRTLGLAIATLVRETQLDAPPEAAPSSPALAEEEKARSNADQEPPVAAPPVARGKANDAPRPAEASSRAAPVRSPERDSSLWLNGGALAAYDHELPSPLRYGGRIGVGVTRPGLPFYASLAGSYSVGRAPGDGQGVARVSLAWATLAAGVGGRTRLPFDAEGRAGIQGVLVDLVAHASAGEDGEEEGQRWVLGGQLEVEVAALRSRPVGFTLGATAQHLTGATAVVVHREGVATSAAFSWSLYGALELHLFR